MKSKNREALMPYLLTSLISVFLLTTLACSEAKTPPPSSSPTRVDQAPVIIDYNRPSAKADEKTPAGGFTSFKLASQLMGREMPYRIVVPDDYKTNATRRYAVIYLLHGLTGNFNDWTDRTKLVQIAAKHNFIIVTPEGNNGWYTDSPLIPGDKYESYIVRELIPEIDRNFRTLADRDHRGIAGLSMGGYGSLKFGLKFPEMFTLVGSFSGALGIPQWSEQAGGNKLIGKSIDKVFGPINSKARKANDVFKITRELSPDRLKDIPYIYLSCGTEDSMVKMNREFRTLLNKKNVPNDYRERRGGHDWVFWDGQMREFLEVADRRFNNNGL